MAGRFNPMPFGGLSAPMLHPAMPTRRVTVGIRVYDPSLTVSERSRIDAYYWWSDNAWFKILTIAGPPLVSLWLWVRLNFPELGFGAAALGIVMAPGVAVGLGLWMTVQHRRAARAELSRVRTAWVTRQTGNHHMFKPDGHSTWSDSGAVDALEAFGDVSVLRGQGLVEDRAWLDLWQEFFDFLAQTTDVRTVLGWGHLEARAHGLLDHARSTQFHIAPSVSPKSTGVAPATWPSNVSTELDIENAERADDADVGGVA